MAASGSGGMTQISDRRAEADEFDSLLASLRQGDWTRPTQFKAWTAEDIVRHLHAGDLLALAGLADAPAGWRPRRDQVRPQPIAPVRGGGLLLGTGNRFPAHETGIDPQHLQAGGCSVGGRALPLANASNERSFTGIGFAVPLGSAGGAGNIPR